MMGMFVIELHRLTTYVKIPTIDFGSFDCMKIVGITDNYDNMTMSLPVQILGKLNAD